MYNVMEITDINFMLYMYKIMIACIQYIFYTFHTFFTELLEVWRLGGFGIWQMSFDLGWPTGWFWQLEQATLLLSLFSLCIGCNGGVLWEDWKQ